MIVMIFLETRKERVMAEKGLKSWWGELGSEGKAVVLCVFVVVCIVIGTPTYGYYDNQQAWEEYAPAFAQYEKNTGYLTTNITPLGEELWESTELESARNLIGELLPVMEGRVEKQLIAKLRWSDRLLAKAEQSQLAIDDKTALSFAKAMGSTITSFKYEKPQEPAPLWLALIGWLAIGVIAAVVFIWVGIFLYDKIENLIFSWRAARQN